MPVRIVVYCHINLNMCGDLPWEIMLCVRVKQMLSHLGRFMPLILMSHPELLSANPVGPDPAHK